LALIRSRIRAKRKAEVRKETPPHNRWRFPWVGREDAGGQGAVVFDGPSGDQASRRATGGRSYNIE